MGFHKIKKKKIHSLHAIAGGVPPPRRKVPVVVFSGELPEPSTELDAKQGPHKYPLNERLRPTEDCFIALDKTHRQTPCQNWFPRLHLPCRYLCASSP